MKTRREKPPKNRGMFLGSFSINCRAVFRFEISENFSCRLRKWTTILPPKQRGSYSWLTYGAGTAKLSSQMLSPLSCWSIATARSFETGGHI